MFLRRWIGTLAIFGMLLHAGLFVRHNAMMLGAALDGAALAAAFGEICFGAKGSTHSPNSTLPQNPDSLQSHCPDCLGLAGAVAMLPPTPPFYVSFYSIASDRLFSTDPLNSADTPLWPPGQGPPAAA
jgi:hypothetical protein